MHWYRLAQQTWNATCPKCNNVWQVNEKTPGWMKAKEAQLAGRTAYIECNECFRKRRDSSIGSGR